MAQQYPPIEKLKALGYEIQQFTDFHFRIGKQIDVWYPKGRWHDLVTGERGKWPLDQIHFHIDRRIKSRTPAEIEKNDFITNLLSIGWPKQEAEDAWEKRRLSGKSGEQHQLAGESNGGRSRQR